MNIKVGDRVIGKIRVYFPSGAYNKTYRGIVLGDFKDGSYTILTTKGKTILVETYCKGDSISKKNMNNLMYCVY